jgi:hypothetical protein
MLTTATITSKGTPPEDRHNLIYAMFFLQGTTVLYVFNAFIKNMMFRAIFKDSSFPDNYDTWITWAIMLTTVLASFILTVLPPKHKVSFSFIQKLSFIHIAF